MDWGNVVSLCSLVVSGIVGLVGLHVRLMIKSEIHEARDAILEKVDQAYACEDTVALRFKAHSREISEMKTRQNRHSERLGQVERQLGCDGGHPTH
jgi:hypothetical protein